MFTSVVSGKTCCLKMAINDLENTQHLWPVDHALRITLTDTIKTCSHERMVRDIGVVATSQRYPEAARTWAREGKLRACIWTGPAAPCLWAVGFQYGEFQCSAWARV